MPTTTQPMRVRLDKAIIEHLKRVARYEPFKGEQDADLIREAIANTYPMLKDEDADTRRDNGA